jgi:hypothetical protein
MNLQTIGGRRFLITLGAGLSTTLLQWFGKIDTTGNTYMLVIIATVGAYIGGNVVENKHNVAAGLGSKDAPPKLD